MDKRLHPYQCALCENKFKLIDELKLHMSLGCGDPTPAKRPRPSRPRTTPRAMQACRSCAASKTKCDNNRECKRCRKRGVRCVRPMPFEHQERSMGSPSIASRNDYARDPTMLSPATEGACEPHNGQESLIATSERAGEVETEPDIHLLDRIQTDHLSIHTHAIQSEVNCANWDLNLLSDHFSLDPPHNMTQEVDMLFSLPGILPDVVGHNHVTITSISPVIAQDKSQLISDAFKMATGRWTPAARDFQEDEEKNLSATPAGMTISESFYSCDMDLLPEGFPLVVRDRLLAMFVSASDSRDNLRISSAFPSCDTLGFLVKSFLAWHIVQDDTWIHIPTFDVNEARIEFVAAILAAGAVRSQSREVQRFGSAIHELLAVQLWKICRVSNILTRDLQFLQAYALQIHIGLWSGDKRKMEIAQGAVGNLVNMLRGGGRFRKSSYSSNWLPVSEHDSNLEETWRKWAQEESFVRLTYHMLFHCGEESLITSISGPLHYTELTLGFPKAKMLWFSKSAVSWKGAFQPRFHQDISHVSLVDCLADVSCLRNLSAMYDQNIARLSVLYGVSALIRTCQQSRTSFHPKDGVPYRESLLVEDSQHRWLVRALESLHQQLKLCPSEPRPPPVTILLVLELLSLHSCASIDQMELLAGKEGFEEAQAAYSALQRWVESHEARQALWHGGQILRLARELPNDIVADFHCVAIYHVSLCLWVYVTISAKSSNGNDESTSTDPGSSKGDYVLLDGDETLETQRWTTLGYGRPMLSNPEEGCTINHGIAVTSHSTSALMQMCMQTLRLKYPAGGVLPPATESFCNLMRALGGIISNDGIV